MVCIEHTATWSSTHRLVGRDRLAQVRRGTTTALGSHPALVLFIGILVITPIPGCDAGKEQHPHPSQLPLQRTASLRISRVHYIHAPWQLSSSTFTDGLPRLLALNTRTALLAVDWSNVSDLVAWVSDRDFHSMRASHIAHVFLSSWHL
jgi:hypothetical protein